MSFKSEIVTPDLAELLQAMTWEGGEISEELVNEAIKKVANAIDTTWATAITNACAAPKGNFVSRHFTIEEMAADGEAVVYLDCKLAKWPREIRPGVFEIEWAPPDPPPLLSINRFLSREEAEARWGLDRIRNYAGGTGTFSEVRVNGERWVPVYDGTLNLAGYERAESESESRSHDDWRELNEL